MPAEGAAGRHCTRVPAFAAYWKEVAQCRLTQASCCRLNSSHRLLAPPLQLSYFHRLFDLASLARSLPKEELPAVQARLAPLAPVLERAAAVAARLRDASAYKWVDLGALYGRLSMLQAAAAGGPSTAGR